MTEYHDRSIKKHVSYTQVQAFEKARSWCAMQERCNQEMRRKLAEWGIRSDSAEEIIAQLIVDGFLNEERYAKAYAGGKFRIKKWGRRKIIQELKRKNISEICIRRGLSVIDEVDYCKTLKKLLDQRIKQIKETNPIQRRAKIINFLVGKGYEAELIVKLMAE
jgi:regulatory protein